MKEAPRERGDVEKPAEPFRRILDDLLTLRSPVDRSNSIAHDCPQVAPAQAPEDTVTVHERWEVGYQLRAKMFCIVILAAASNY